MLVLVLDGWDEADLARPLTRTGTNLLGLIKHLSVGEARYFGQVFDRPFAPHLPWWDDDAPEGADLWVTSSESRQDILDTYRAVIAHADETIRSLELDASGHVPWWPRPDVTLHGVLVHVLAETARHAGHADILREQLDGRTGMRADNLNQEPRRPVVGELPITDRIRRALRCFEVSQLQHGSPTRTVCTQRGRTPEMRAFPSQPPEAD